MKVLVTGFGAFPGVPENPTAALARAVDGARVGPATVIGRVLPVSYARGPDAAIAAARDERVSLVIGLGVATQRPGVCVERRGLRVAEGRPDVDGATACGLEGPDEVPSTVDVERLARALGATVSDDAGGYVCNAWLYRVAHALQVPVAFVHVPAAGLPAERLLAAVADLLA